MYSLILNNLNHNQKQQSQENEKVLQCLYWLNSLCLFSFTGTESTTVKQIGNASVVDDEKLLADLQFLMDEGIIQNASICENEFSFFFTDKGLELISQFDVCFSRREIESILVQ